MPEETLKYTADFSQIAKEVDEVNAKVERLSASLDKTAKKFGADSPQATMVKNSLDRVMAELDKKIGIMEKLQQQQTKPGDDKKTPGRRSSDEDLERRFKRESLRYYRDFNQSFGRTAGSLGKLVTGGITGLATGRGIGGFATGLGDLGKVLMTNSGKQFLSTFIQSGIIGGLTKGAISGIAGGAGGAGAGAGAGAAGAGTGGIGGVGGALLSAVKALPSAIILGLGAITTVAGLAAGSTAFLAKDVFARTRRAAGFGANVGEMTGFEDTLSRFVDPDNVLKSMQQAKFDITSPAYAAMRIAGIDPSKSGSQTYLAEQNVVRAQTELKKMYAENPQTLLTMAHARGFQNRGFSDEDIIRLAQGDQGEVNKLVKKGLAAAPDLDINERQRKAFDDLITDTDLLGDKLKTFGEYFSTEVVDNVKIFDDLLKEIDGGMKTFSDWMKKLAPTNDPDKPSAEGTAVQMEAAAAAGGGFIEPGTGRRIGGPGGGAPPGIRGRARGGGSAVGIGPIEGKGADAEAKAGSFADAMKVLQGAGLSRGEAAALAGEATAESRLGTMYGGNVLGVGTGDSGSASGMFQWHSDRWNPLVAWAKSQGLDPTKASTQYKMAAHEYITRFRKSIGPRIKAAGDDPTALERAMDPFEGFAGFQSGTRASGVSGVGRALKEDPGIVVQPKKDDKVSLSNMSHFQGNNKAYAIKIDNPAGASYSVAGGILGTAQGNFGNA